MSAQEREQAELEFAAGSFGDPEALKARMAFWDAGLKRNPACNDMKIADATSCECMTAGTYTSPVCTFGDGVRCLSRSATQATKDKHGIGDCQTNFPITDTAPAGTLVPIAPVIVDDKTGRLIIFGLATVLLLAVTGHIKL